MSALACSPGGEQTRPRPIEQESTRPSNSLSDAEPAPSLPGVLPVDPARAYLAMVRPSNCALYRYQASAASITRNGRYWREDWPKIEADMLPLAERLSVEKERLREAFRSYDWPEEVRPFEKALDEELRVDIDWYTQAASVTSWVEFQAAYARDHPDPRIGREIRKALGLQRVTEDPDPCVNTDGGTVRRIS